MKIKLKKYKKVKSTNDIAIKLIKKNNTCPMLVTSEQQTNGRGRVGKKWISQKGNLFMSLFFKIDQKKINFKQFAVLNAFLLKKVISKKISKKIRIKWPNDILFNKKKFCGILQELIRINNFDYLVEPDTWVGLLIILLITIALLYKTGIYFNIIRLQVVC